MKTNMVRVKHWVQDTVESGHWELTGLMSRLSAEKICNDIVEQGEIVEAEQYED